MLVDMAVGKACRTSSPHGVSGWRLWVCTPEQSRIEMDPHKGTHTLKQIMLLFFYRWAGWRTRLQHKPTLSCPLSACTILSCCLRRPQRPVGCRPRNSQELMGKITMGQVATRRDAYDPATSSHRCKLLRVHWSSLILCSLAVHPRTHENQNRTETTQHKQEHGLQAMSGFCPLQKATHAQSAVEGV